MSVTEFCAVACRILLFQGGRPGPEEIKAHCQFWTVSIHLRLSLVSSAVLGNVLYGAGRSWWPRQQRICLQPRRPRYGPWVRKVPWKRWNGNPLQYSCPQNSKDRGVWWATVHGVAKSQTQLSDSHTDTHTIWATPSLMAACNTAQPRPWFPLLFFVERHLSPNHASQTWCFRTTWAGGTCQTPSCWPHPEFLSQ